MKSSYFSQFDPRGQALEVLQKGRILGEFESPSQMVERVVHELVGVEGRFGMGNLARGRMEQELGSLMDERKLIFSTPILTNAGRNRKPLSACTIPHVGLRSDFAKLKEVIAVSHEAGMGTGFDFNEIDNPVEMLELLNEVAVLGAESGREQRPVGNIAVLSVHHPSIKEFIFAKKNAREDWKFNISIDVTERFMHAVRRGEKYSLTNGETLDANLIFELLSQSALESGEPGIVFLERLNRDNPVPSLGAYASVAPCAEVGLSPGESCQFGYLNLGEFVRGQRIDFDLLDKATRILTRSLDNALELSIGRFEFQESADIMIAKRKIGVGVCGLADMLIKLGLPYDSKEGRVASRDAIAFVNYVSKKASVILAVERGNFGAFEKSRYMQTPGFLTEKYGALETANVSSKHWHSLERDVREYGIRNCSTISLPPTGRSGLIINASTGIEPLFNLCSHGEVNSLILHRLHAEKVDNGEILSAIRKAGSCQSLDISSAIKGQFKTAIEIDPIDHLMMVAEIIRVVDESVSKTVNVPGGTTTEAVREIFKAAYDSGIKGVTIYANRHLKQPIPLASE